MRTARSTVTPELDPEPVHQALVELANLVGHAFNVATSQKEQAGILFTCFQPKAAFISQLDASRGLLEVVATRGRNDPRIVAATPGEGTVGEAFQARKLVVGEGMSSFPVVSANGVFGCVTFLNPRVPITEPVARSLGAQVAVAWDAAKLRDEANRRNKDLETALAGLKSLEKNREELLSNVSHELKNPLSTIKAYLAMLSGEKLGPVVPDQSRALSACERNVDRLQRMVNDLLLLSRLKSEKMQLDERPFGLKAIAEEVASTLAPHSAPNRVHIRIPPCSEVYVRGDRERLFEAVYNLVENAALHSEAQRTVEVTVSAKEGFAQLEVEDHGFGIGEEELKHLFDPFHRLHANESSRRLGASLGLPIVAKIARLHGGRVEAESTPGTGSRFRLFLPMFAGPASSIPVPAPRTGGILLVEDDADSREVLHDLLDQEGFSVTTAESATAALEILGEMRPALVLLDLHRSDADGRIVLRHIRKTERLQDTAVYLISGATEVASLAAGKGLDRIDGYFEKPVQLPKLLATLSTVVTPAAGKSDD